MAHAKGGAEREAVVVRLANERLYVEGENGIVQTMMAGRGEHKSCQQCFSIPCHALMQPGVVESRHQIASRF